MDKLSAVHSVAAPLDGDSVDTEAIIPKQFMKSIRRIGCGSSLFDAWRYLDPGNPAYRKASELRILTSC